MTNLHLASQQKKGLKHAAQELDKELATRNPGIDQGSPVRGDRLGEKLEQRKDRNPHFAPTRQQSSQSATKRSRRKRPLPYEARPVSRPGTAPIPPGNESNQPWVRPGSATPTHSRQGTARTSESRPPSAISGRPRTGSRPGTAQGGRKPEVVNFETGDNGEGNEVEQGGHGTPEKEVQASWGGETPAADTRPASELSSKELYDLARRKEDDEGETARSAIFGRFKAKDAEQMSVEMPHRGHREMEQAETLENEYGVTVGEYNQAIEGLREKIEQKGPNAFRTHFELAKGAKPDSRVSKESFFSAMNNINCGVRPEAAFVLAKDSGSMDDDGNIDFDKLLRSVSSSRKDGLPLRGQFADHPLGLYAKAGPGALARETERMGRKQHASKVSLGDLKEALLKRGSTVDRPEFEAALKELNPHLNEREMKDIYLSSKARKESGKIDVNQFVDECGGPERHWVPWFLWPRTTRRSDNGHPWEWVVPDS